jgi:chemotaxis protein MotA
MAALEPEVEDPKSGKNLSPSPEVLNDELTLGFLCDSLRMLIIGVTTPSELDHQMDLDIETQRRGNHEPVSALGSIAEALPGLGIVAAVLQNRAHHAGDRRLARDGGRKSGSSSLVATLLGILLCYGVWGLRPRDRIPLPRSKRNISKSCVRP